LSSPKGELAAWIYEHLKAPVRHIPGAKKVWRRLSPEEQSEGHCTRVAEWDRLYRTGHWDYLSGLEEAARYNLIVGYLHYLKRGGAFLDVGCGEGILLQRLGPSAYSRYLGIDFSQVAIAKARQRQDGNTLFIVANAEEYEPKEAFDAIIFNECLYCFKDPFETFKRYVPSLQQGGIIVVSMYAPPGMDSTPMRILEKIKTAFNPLDEITITRRVDSWICNIFML
jgi:SAM-dependent methyltransferase